MSRLHRHGPRSGRPLRSYAITEGVMRSGSRRHCSGGRLVSRRVDRSRDGLIVVGMGRLVSRGVDRSRNGLVVVGMGPRD